MADKPSDDDKSYRADGDGRHGRPGRPAGGRPASGRPSGGKPSGGRPASGRPSFGRPSSDRPAGGGPAGGRPAGGRPSSDRPRRDEAPRDGKPGERREWKPREGGPRDGKPREKREYGDRPRPERDRSTGERMPREERPELTPEQLRARALRPVRKEHEDLPIDEDVTLKMLERTSFNELKALTEENAEYVGLHLVMVARYVDEDPERALSHALSASRRGGRIACVREAAGVAAYTAGDFALALRELNTFTRISGSNEQIALMVDCERGLGRSERALELGRSIDRKKLSDLAAVNLAIAMSGARLDLGQTELALAELEIPQLNPDAAFSYSPALFWAYGEVLEELGRNDEAQAWRRRADVAQQALDETYGTAGEFEDQVIMIEYPEVVESGELAVAADDDGEHGESNVEGDDA